MDKKNSRQCSSWMLCASLAVIAAFIFIACASNKAGSNPVASASGANRATDCNFDNSVQPAPAPDDAQLLASQYYIASASAAQSLDLNLPAATLSNDASTFGKGQRVKVAVIDFGVDILHADLRANISYEDNLNLAIGLAGNSPCLRNPSFSGEAGSPINHGTSVAGIIAARDNNGIGIRGVASRSLLSGINLLLNPNTTTFMQMIDHLVARRVLVMNNSYGQRGQTGWLQLLPPSVEKGYMLLTNENGSTSANPQPTVPIFSAGNAGSGLIPVAYNSVQGLRLSTASANDSLSYPVDMASLTEELNLFSVIAVGAVSRSGLRANFSEKSASLWTSSFGEQITTLESGQKYVRDFSGTSAATPMVSGVVTLMFETAAAQNKNLSYRDVRLILAEAGQTTGRFPAELSGLITNSGSKYSGASGGYKYHTGYGFGVLDAAEAVRLTQNWTPIPTASPLKTLRQMATIPEGGIAFTDESAMTPAQSTLTITTNEINRIEYMTVYVMTDGTDHGDLEVKLISSSGTAVNLLEPHFCARPDSSQLAIHCGTSPTRTESSADLRIGSEPWRFGNAAHLGEDPNQTWTLEVRDMNKNDRGAWATLSRVPLLGASVSALLNHDKDGGKLMAWGINFYGRKDP